MNSAYAPGGSIRNVTPLGVRGTPGFTQHCGNCAIATDLTLSGRPTSAMPIYDGKGTSHLVLENFFNGGRFRFNPATQVDITNRLQNAVDGARGIIWGYRGPNKMGHFFNGVNQNGTIRFLDGQTGGQANWNDGYRQFRFMWTNIPPKP